MQEAEKKAQKHDVHYKNIYKGRFLRTQLMAYELNKTQQHQNNDTIEGLDNKSTLELRGPDRVIPNLKTAISWIKPE